VWQDWLVYPGVLDLTAHTTEAGITQVIIFFPDGRGKMSEQEHQKTAINKLLF
jgi:hypothetical protein